jgi:hypothetical protein
MPGIFRIRQLESPQRVLTLRGRALPKQGFEFGLTQRGEVRWQIGSMEGEAILTGGMLEPTDFDFSWKAQTLGAGAEVDGAQIETVRDLVRTVWGMVRQSVLVTVEWDIWAQVGYLKNITVPIEKPNEFAVSIAVEWVKEDERNMRRRPKPAADYGSTVSSLSDGWSAALRTIRRPLALAAEAQQRAEDAVVSVNNRINEMQRARRQFRDSAVSSAAVSGRLAESMASIASEGATLRTVAGEQPFDVLPIDEPAARLVYEHYRASLARAAGGVRWQAALERRKLLSEARPDVLRRHVALEDEDLRLLAWVTYGRVDAWQAVAEFNEWTGSTLRAGQTVLLPRLEAARVA